MRISWITFQGHIRNSDDSISYNAASLRYRVLMPIREMCQEYRHVLVAASENTLEKLKKNAAKTDVMIISKSFLASNEGLVQEARALGARIIFDVCDNYYDDPTLGTHYRNMSALADQVVCNTSEMARVAEAYCRTKPVVIGDPYEGPKGVATFCPQQELKLLWFGYPANLDSLQEALGDLLACSIEHKISLTLLTRLDDTILNGCTQVNTRYGDHFTMSAKEWSLDDQWQELAACDAVIIPSLQDPRKQAKSANRMLEALWAGRPVVAQPMPAYLAFETWTPVRPTLSEGLRWLVANQARAPVLVAQAQAYIEEHYSPAVLSRHWEELIEEQYAKRASA